MYQFCLKLVYDVIFLKYGMCMGRWVGIWVPKSFGILLYLITRLLLHRWGVLFSHPRDYTPVCTTELAREVELVPEFTKRDVKLIALSPDSVANHRGWEKV